MPETNINAVTLKSLRIIHKHDIEENWNKANNFAPLLGEIIVYDPDTTHPNPRYKIGIWDGKSEKTQDMLVMNLPFTNKIGEAIDVIEYNANTPAYTAAYDSTTECLTLTALGSVKCISATEANS